MAFVYWIHLPEHTDMFSEGYVGVTSNTVANRYKGHWYAAESGSKLHVHKAMLKYRERLIVDTLIEGSEAYCYQMEGNLRPNPNIGYNIAIGGEVSPMSGKNHTPEVVERLREISTNRMKSPDIRKTLSVKCSGYKHTPEAVEKIRQASTGRTHSDASKQKMSEGKKSGYVPKDAWQTPRSDKEFWAKAILVWDFMQTKKRVGWKSTSEKFNTKKSSVKTLCKKIKDGWNPNLDDAYLLWLEQYKQKESANVS